jgi:peptidoglycan/LPS O-acetylase OafA/YrhL
LTLTAWSVAFAGLLVLLVSAEPGQWLGWLGRFRVLHWLGRYSYGIYVFQLPLLYALAGVVTAPGLAAWAGNPWAGQLLYAALLTTANLALALASWHLVEKRVLAWKRWFEG